MFCEVFYFRDTPKCTSIVIVAVRDSVRQQKGKKNDALNLS